VTSLPATIFLSITKDAPLMRTGTNEFNHRTSSDLVPGKTPMARPKRLKVSSVTMALALQIAPLVPFLVPLPVSLATVTPN